MYATATQRGLEPDQLEELAKASQRAARDRAVTDLSAEGHSNAEINRRIGLHRDAVARIVQRQLRRRGGDKSTMGAL